MNAVQPTFSVTEFLEYINLTIGRRHVAIEGEISGYNLNQGKWIFFDLKDKDSKVGCFAVAYQMQFPLEDGMQIIVHGTPRVYARSGKFSVMVERIELKGAGALKKAFELTKAKLQQEGLFDLARKRALPEFPDAIGLIASKESAAYTDFMRILNQRWGGVEVYLLHVAVQGESAIDEISKAFDWFNTHGYEYGIGALCLIRGGGSLEDLQAFNSEAVARAVFACRFPVVCGVGHERDESLADYAADVRAATPTHAATLLFPDRSEMHESIRASVARLRATFEHQRVWHSHRVDRALGEINGAFLERTSHVREVVHSLQSAGQAFSHKAVVVHNSVIRAAELITERIETVVRGEMSHIEYVSRTFSNLNPMNVVQRGYSIVRKKGRIIRSKSQLAHGESVELTFSDGSLPAEILSPQGKLL